MRDDDHTIAWSYRTGPWYAGFGPEVTVLLPGSQRRVASDLWARIDAGAGFDDVLDGLLAAGLRTLPGFVLIGATAEATRLLVRGEGVSATVTTGEEQVSLDGPGDAVWAERSFSSAASVTVTLPRDEESGRPADDVDREILTGLVPVGRVDRPARTAPATGRTPVTGPVLAAVPDVPDTPPVSEATSVTDVPSAVARLLTSDGQDFLVDRAVLIGRAPRSREDAAESPALLTVPSPQKEISSTHVEIRPGAGDAHGTAVVTDLGSTNGTAVTQPEQDPVDLRPGIALALQPGALVDLGDGVTVEVTGP